MYVDLVRGNDTGLEVNVVGAGGGCLRGRESCLWLWRGMFLGRKEMCFRVGWI